MENHTELLNKIREALSGATYTGATQHKTPIDHKKEAKVQLLIDLLVELEVIEITEK